jgi:basic membrane protein A
MLRICLAGVVALMGTSALAQDLEIAMLLPGNIEDNGFMEAGYNGLLAIESELGAKTSYIDQVKPEQALLEKALRELADQSPDMVIAHGGQNSKAAEVVAPEYPDIEFVVVQGGVTGPNLSSYEVLQEESAWLAGAAAGLMTKTGVVGHISGIRVPPGLKGRAAFYDGLKHSKPEAKFLTIFAGDQDDNALSERVARMEIEQGADIIFTMLNAGRTGATDAMRETGTRHIGNVIDWTAIEPGVFVASAVANVSIPSIEAVRDFKSGEWKPGVIKSIGLENTDAVSLTLAGDVPAEIRAELDELRKKIVDDEIEVSIQYDGPELKL